MGAFGRARLLVVLAVVALGLGWLAVPAGAARPNGPAPLLGASGPDVIAGRYIVVMRSGASAASVRSARDDARAQSARIRLTYGAALKGFAASLPPDALRQVRANPDVAYVEADRRVSIATTQSPASWALDRIDERYRPLNGSYTYFATAATVSAYIIDTGFRFMHAEFQGRAFTGYDAITPGGAARDCNGHGTHVAGSVGSRKYGVAKQVRLVSVRVLDCEGSGTVSQVIEGIDFVTVDHGPDELAVANMSLSGSASSALDAAVNASINDGVTYVVAAGNENTSALYFSPGRVQAAITVGATASNDTRALFSNKGGRLDLFAPGVGVRSTWVTSNTATAVLSGTSMAAPHVTGTAALYLARNPSATPAEVRNALVSRATTGVLTNIGTNSPNRLLYARL